MIELTEDFMALEGEDIFGSALFMEVLAGVSSLPGVKGDPGLSDVSWGGICKGGIC